VAAAYIYIIYIYIYIIYIHTYIHIQKKILKEPQDESGWGAEPSRQLWYEALSY
jgi:hypothetical protein